MLFIGSSRMLLCESKIVTNNCEKKQEKRSKDRRPTEIREMGRSTEKGRKVTTKDQKRQINEECNDRINEECNDRNKMTKMKYKRKKMQQKYMDRREKERGREREGKSE